MKVFLSHSSKDKDNYVRIVADKLGYNSIHYDELTFEVGMKTLEEIQKSLTKTDLFVLFLSNASLDSEWVKKEIVAATHLHNEGLIKQIYPIIVDNTIAYSDPRIPQWMRDEYNLKYVSKPTIAFRRITQRLREMSWARHPNEKEREKIFVGRNELLKKFEERMDSASQKTPTCVIASGLPSSGRRSLLTHCLIKANIVDESYKAPVIALNSHESLEDFILKVNDLGFSSKIDTMNLLKKTIPEKTLIAFQLVEDLYTAKEVLLIIDNGAIVLNDRTLSKWFAQLLDKIGDSGRITFIIASSVRPFEHLLRHNVHVFTLEVPELSENERIGLLKRYAKIEKISLSSEDLVFLGNLHQGYPEQVFFTVNLVKSIGLSAVKKDPAMIVDFNSEKSVKVLSRYQSNDEALSFLYLLARFDYISFEFIFEIVGDNIIYRNLLNDFVSLAICEYLGSNREYIRLNDTVRDYISRNRFLLPLKYEAKIKEHVEKFWQNYQPDDVDASDFFFSIKQTLLKKHQIEDKYLVPSHFLKTMKELYDTEKKYLDVIELADRVLLSKAYLDENLLREIRYFLCLALARRKEKRFLNEVQYLDGIQHNFLLGFYYRLIGRYGNAIEKFKSCLDERPTFAGARRELVQVYLSVEDFDTAKAIAKQNFESDKSNPYHIQAYFNSLIRGHWLPDDKIIMKELLDRLRALKAEKADEMYKTAIAQYTAFCEKDHQLALQYIDAAIKHYQDKVYPLLAKFDICEKFGDKDGMRNTLTRLDGLINDSSSHYHTMLKARAVFFASIGRKEDAKIIVMRDLQHYPENAKQKILQRIVSYH